jgi:hypothetical protein
MMKRLTWMLIVLLLAAPLAIWAQRVEIKDWQAAYGDWKMVGNRLAQLDTKAGMAMVHARLPQSGVMQYEFDVEYIDGLQDRYGGFGVHLFVDQPHPRKAWGDGKSHLLWVTYDPKAYGGWGIYGQAYRSNSKIEMDLLHRPDAYALPASYASRITADTLTKFRLPVKIVVDAGTGLIKVYDPTRPNYLYKFTLGGPLGKGTYASLRTNSLAASFGNVKVTRLQ